jgi:hypothetical protein
VSLVNAARHGGALSSLSALTHLLEVARNNIAVDAGLNLVDFATRASQMADRPLSLYTLPISDFGKDANGSDINLVDVSAIRQIVHQRFFSDTPAAPPAVSSTTQPPPALAEPVVLDVVNATSTDGLAASLEDTLPAVDLPEAAPPLPRPQQTTAPSNTAPVPPKAPAAASDTVSPGTVRLTVGTRFPAGDYLVHPVATSDGSASGQVTAVAATGTGAHVPARTELSQMAATSTPYVEARYVQQRLPDSHEDNRSASTEIS